MTLSLESVIGFINASLAPAVVFTGVGLLLAGLQAKYSTIVQVIRQLNAERRAVADDPSARDTLTMLTSQIDSLMIRGKLVRNSVCSFYVTIFFLVLSSILMGLGALGLGSPVLAILTTFGAALLALFAGIAFATREALLSYQVVQIEIRRWMR